MAKRGNKKGFELAISTVIIILLSLALLITILAFWDRQTGIFSDFLENIAGKSNVDENVASCNAFYAQQSIYEFCCVKREIKFGGGKEELRLTCEGLADEETIAGRINKLNCDNSGC